MERSARVGGTPLIALVEDDWAVRWSTLKLLEKRGFDVLAFDGGDALLAARLPEALEAILLDIQLPGSDGLEVLRALGRLPSAPPVIVLTGRVDVETAVEARALGAAALLAKPCPVPLLLGTIERVLAERR